MTFKLACGDVMPGCAAVFENDDEDALLGEVGTHAAADHDLAAIPPEVLTLVRSKITVA